MGWPTMSSARLFFFVTPGVGPRVVSGPCRRSRSGTGRFPRAVLASEVFREQWGKTVVRRGASCSIESAGSLSREGKRRSHLFIIRRGESAEIWGRPSWKGEGKSWVGVVGRVAGWQGGTAPSSLPKPKVPLSLARQPERPSSLAAFVLFWHQADLVPLPRLHAGRSPS